MTEMLGIYSKGFLENMTIEEWPPNPLIHQNPFIRNVFDFWNNLVLN